jgi:hypothetical protein
MNTMTELPIWVWVPVVLFGPLVLNLMRVPLRHFITHLSGSVKTPLLSTSAAVQNARQGVAHADPVVQGHKTRAIATMAEVLDLLIATLQEAASGLRQHMHAALDQAMTSPNHKMVQVLGHLMLLAYLPLFAFADVGQGANTLVTLFPGEIIPEALRNIMVPLLVASVGSAVALSMMLGDLVGITHFSAFGTVRGWGRAILIAVVLLTFMFVASCSVALALNRSRDLINLVQEAQLPLVTSVLIYRWAAFAQSLVIIPLLITTFLLFRSIVGLLIVYAFLVGITTLTFAVASQALRIVKIIITGMGEEFATLTIRVLFITAQVAFGVFAWLIGQLGVLVVNLGTGVLNLTETVLSPVFVVGHIFRSLLIKVGVPFPSYDFHEHFGAIDQSIQKGVNEMQETIVEAHQPATPALTNDIHAAKQAPVGVHTNGVGGGDGARHP